MATQQCGASDAANSGNGTCDSCGRPGVGPTGIATAHRHQRRRAMTRLVGASTVTRSGSGRAVVRRQRGLFLSAGARNQGVLGHAALAMVFVVALALFSSVPSPPAGPASFRQMRPRQQHQQKHDPHHRGSSSSTPMLLAAAQDPPFGGPPDGPQAFNNVEDSWDFDIGLEQWANSSAEQMDAEVYQRGGEMRLRLRGPHAFVDSPLFMLEAHDDMTLVMRMRYAGRSRKANFRVRTAPSAAAHPPARYATGDPDWEDGNGYIDLDFDIVPDNEYHTYYVPLYDFRNPTPELQNYVTQLRLHPATDSASLALQSPDVDHSSRLGQSVYIDFIRITKKPTITAVLNCAWLPPQYKGNEIYPVHPAGLWVRPTGPLNQRFAAAENATFTRRVGIDNETLTYGITYNCLRAGGERIMLVGRNFGTAGARVTVDGRPCSDVVHETPNTHVSCITPPGSRDTADVTIAEGNMPGLQDTRPYLSYIVGAFATRQPTISNIASRSVHINWRASDDWWDSLTITGYNIERRYAVDDSPDFESQWVWSEWHGSVVVGNVTVTTLIGLLPQTNYQFRIAPLSEDVVFSEEWQELDLYGRRPAVAGAVQGNFSEPTVTIKTLRVDFEFTRFDANATLDYGAADKRASSGQLGLETGEGHYGLVLVGDANVENCNASSTCCDGYDTVGPDACTLSCSARSAYRPLYLNKQGFRDSVNEPPSDDRWTSKGPQGPDITESALPPPLPTPETNFANGITIGPRSNLTRAPRYACGPALRLTASQARLSGAAWYSRQQQVREGFDTTFTVRLSNPSTLCKFMDDVYTNCRSRGGDGFAFVIQNQHPAALGSAGGHMGYGGVANSVAIEFDTYLNPENLDPGENHVSVQTRGFGSPNSPNHTFEIGNAVESVPDLSDLTQTIQIVYTPEFDVEALQEVSFMASPHMGSFVVDGDFPGGGMPSWGTGMGTLKVFFNRQKVAALTVPINLDATLKLQNGRAWVGFTAATGISVWQTHDILDWEFTQLRNDYAAASNRYPPRVINDVGKFKCSGLWPCVHPPSSDTGRSKQRDNKFVWDRDTPF